MLNKLILTDEPMNPVVNIGDISTEKINSEEVKTNYYNSFTSPSALNPVSSIPRNSEEHKSNKAASNSRFNDSQSDILDFESSSESIQEFLACHDFEEPSTSEPDMMSHGNQLSESLKLPTSHRILPQKSEEDMPNQAKSKLGIKIANSLTESLNPSRSYRKKSQSNGGAACVNCEIY